MAIVLNPADPFLELAYITVEWADDYFTYDLDASAWKSQTDPDIKKSALVMATRTIDTHNFRGVKQDIEQTLQFPRVDERTNYILTDIQRIKYAQVLADTVENVPESIRKATAEQALYILKQISANGSTINTADLAQLKGAGVNSYSVGDVAVSFKGTDNVRQEQLCPKSFGYVAQFIKRFGRLI